jgi:hypothetical protein
MQGQVRQRQPAFVIARVRRSPALTRSTGSSRVSGCHYEELPRLVSLACQRPASRSWRIASARLERRRSKRKSSIRSTRLRGREIVVTRAGGRSAFSTMAASSRLASCLAAPCEAASAPTRVGTARGDRQPIKLPRGKFETVGPDAFRLGGGTKCQSPKSARS